MKFERLGFVDENYIILDTETTGFAKTDEVIELALVDFDGKVIYDQIFNPHRKLPREIVELTGISDDDTRGMPTFKDEWSKIKKLLNGKRIIAHNADFDFRLIMQTLTKYNIDTYEFLSIVDEKIDSIKVAKKIIKLEKYGQAKIAEFFNIKNKRAHRASNDCLELLEILKALNNL